LLALHQALGRTPEHEPAAHRSVGGGPQRDGHRARSRPNARSRAFAAPARGLGRLRAPRGRARADPWVRSGQHADGRALRSDLARTVRGRAVAFGHAARAEAPDAACKRADLLRETRLGAQRGAHLSRGTVGPRSDDVVCSRSPASFEISSARGGILRGSWTRLSRSFPGRPIRSSRARSAATPESRSAGPTRTVSRTRT